ncbi:hypothetical protein ABZ901_02975 [Actinacidiphila alni]|uniref:hypothetical protein n=1 Tax=Actinacidiphila alni TaxID=380248 RepID=UPI0033DEB6DC
MTHTTSGTRASGGRLRLNPSYGSWDLIWSHVHRVLVVNLGLAVTNAPLLLALQAAHQPWRYPLFFAVLSLGIGPSLAAAFGYLRCADDDERAPVAEVFRAYRRHARRALLVWTPFALLAAIATSDAIALRHAAPGPALIPPLLVVALIAAGSGITAMACLADENAPSLRRTVLVATYTQVRRWPLALMNLGLTAVALVIVNQAPLYGLAVVPGCVLFVIWRNSRAMLTSVPPMPAGGTDVART